MRIGLFVEGSTHEGDWLEKIWVECLLSFSSISDEVIVYGISKANVVAMDERVRNLSSTVEPLDAMVSRLVKRDALESILVCWDLVPKWNSHAKPCRWRETLDFYSYLAKFESMPEVFRESANRRLTELEARSVPSARVRLPSVTQGSIHALIMDPMFETVLLSESAFRNALGLEGPRPKGWPKSWDSRSSISPDKTIAEAITAARRIRPRPSVLRKINKGFEVAKNEWGYFLLMSMIESDIDALKASPIVSRLADLR